MKENCQKICQWIEGIAQNISLPLKSMIKKKRFNDVDLAVQFYRSRNNGRFCVELKLYNQKVCSFGESSKRNFPIFDQRIYVKKPIIGQKPPADLWVDPLNCSHIEILKHLLVDQGCSVFGSINSLRSLLLYYKGALEGVYIADRRVHAADAEMWLPKINGYLNENP
ncbi:hypothetical protein ACE1CI_25755 [Aerosakkonemataceae cyanobacterium BLCC-F50]|uniref:Uncharacterized protein n=2 Tax=Floridanema TaxID=3396149 RepID=A0ABV4XZI5_9CYAN